ncbi:MAG: hypothetical protein WBV31_14615 [Terriglobales bacterium]
METLSGRLTIRTRPDARCRYAHLCDMFVATRRYLRSKRVLLALLLVGVGWLDTPPARAAAKDACSLITSADASAALGSPVARQQRDSDSIEAEITNCKFNGVGVRAESVTLTADYRSADVNADLNGVVEKLKSEGFKAEREIEGVGDSAIWAANFGAGSSVGELYVRRDGCGGTGVERSPLC